MGSYLSKDKLGFTVIGCGNFGMRRIKSITDNKQAELICVVDVDKERAEQIAKKYGCDYYTDFREAIKRKDVHCVIVATPNNLHGSISLAALQNRKHVWCEKPLTINLKEASDMIRTASKNKIFLKTGSNLRYFPSVQKVIEILKNNYIGDILFLRGWIGNSGKHLNSWYSDKKISGGGTLLDNGFHIIDLTILFLEKIKECMGYVTTISLPNKDLEDNAFAILKSSNGKIAFIQSSWREWNSYMYMEVYGEDGYTCIDNRGPVSKTILKKNDGYNEVFDYSNEKIQSYELELKDYIQCIMNNKQPHASGLEGTEVLKIIHGIYESSKTGKRVVL